jgi:chorismate--pyruvate lyase
MKGRSLRMAHWRAHVNTVNAPAALRHWLTGGGSLTAKLKAHSVAFRVQKLHQDPALCLADEAHAIGLHRSSRVVEREVLLRCDGVPVVFGHTVVPTTATASDWPAFSALGEKSLGSTLFGDPQVHRGALEYARLRATHPLAMRACAAAGIVLLDGEMLYARRCLYRRHRGVLLVTEVFLPHVLELVPGGVTIELKKAA